MSAPARETDKASVPKPPEGLSQFFARVLGQLLLSSWIPAGAVVAAMVFLFSLADEIDALPKGCADGTCSAASVVHRALSSIAHVSLGGALVILLLVVVCTVLTQAFTFEAIRTLEGYWGSRGWMESVAAWRTKHHRNVGLDYVAREKRLDASLVGGIVTAIQKEESERLDHRETPVMTPNMIEVLAAGLAERSATVTISDDELKVVMDFDWMKRADPELVRQLVNVQLKTSDYPSPAGAMPTKIGNIIKAHEEAMSVDDVESFIQDHYDELPQSLQQAHDDEKTRLDLYATLVFVLPLIAGVALLRPGFTRPEYLVVIEVLVLGLTWLAHRAATVSARAYGSVLVSAAKSVQEASSDGRP